MTERLDNSQLFWRMNIEELNRQYPGKWIAINKGYLIGSSSEKIELLKEVIETQPDSGKGTFLYYVWS